jgi:hypothetical protein
MAAKAELALPKSIHANKTPSAGRRFNDRDCSFFLLTTKIKLKIAPNQLFLSKTSIVDQIPS